MKTKLIFPLCIGLCALFILAFAAGAAPAGGSFGESVWWSYDSSTKVMTVTGSGEMRNIGITDLSPKPAYWDVKTITVEAGVTSIGDRAFANLTFLAEVKLPSTITYIGEYAFYSCKNLKSINIPTGVTTIGEGAFQYCSSLTSVRLPSALTEIGMSAFEGSGYYKKDANWSGSLLYLDGCLLAAAGGLHGDLTIESGTRMIADKVFAWGTGEDLVSVTFPASLKIIGGSAFSDCADLLRINFAEGLTVIGPSAFARCYSLAELKLPQSVTTIGDGAFAECSELSEITIPSGVTKIGASAFSKCSGLSEFTVPIGVSTVGAGAFRGCSGLKKLTFENPNCKIESGIFRINEGGLSIYGYPGSTAESFAKTEGCTFVPLDHTVRLTVGKSLGYVDGVQKQLDAAPKIVNDRVLVPVRFISEAFGAKVDWNGATSTATITDVGGSVISVRIGASAAVVNGTNVILDAPAQIDNGRTYLPVRMIAEALGAKVNWDGATSTATFTRSEVKPAASAPQASAQNAAYENAVKENCIRFLLDYCSDYGYLEQDLEMHMLYLNDDAYPEFWFSSGIEADGGMLCTYNGNISDAVYTSALWPIEYKERGNLLHDAGGQGGCYYDAVYSIQNGKFVRLGYGEYMIKDEYYFESDPTPEMYDYVWENLPVSVGEYRQKLSAIYPV